MVFLFLKDIIIIILSLTSGNYSSFSGWGGFGYFWLRTIGKMSIVLSLTKIFFFRFKYFRMFTNFKGGCLGWIQDSSNTLYSWASLNDRNPEFFITMLVLSIYLPLIIHCIIGVLESTYILIIWIAVLLFF